MSIISFISDLGTQGQPIRVKCEKKLIPDSIVTDRSLMHPEGQFVGMMFSCHICRRQFRTRWSLNRHMTVFHSNKEVPQCAICGKRFPSPFNLKVHELSHSSVKEFTCTKCKKSFKYKHSLKQHRC